MRHVAVESSDIYECMGVTGLDGFGEPMYRLAEIPRNALSLAITETKRHHSCAVSTLRDLAIPLYRTTRVVFVVWVL